MHDVTRPCVFLDLLDQPLRATLDLTDALFSQHDAPRDLASSRPAPGSAGQRPRPASATSTPSARASVRLPERRIILHMPHRERLNTLRCSPGRSVQVGRQGEENSVCLTRRSVLPSFLPNTTPRYRSDAILSSPHLEKAPVVRLNRQGERSQLLIWDDEGWMGRIVVLGQYLTWAAKVPKVS